MNNNSEFDVVNLLLNINDSLSYEAICRWTKYQKKQYVKLLNHFALVNKDIECSNSTKEKGDALEKLVAFLIDNCGRIFEVDRDVRTGTNEIDAIMKLTPAGKILCKDGIISPKYENFISECKNYKAAVNVTYVGKFCSLMLTTGCKLGIMFSYKGVTGTKWNAASGLIKKFYMSKENLSDRYCLIDFNYNDFNKVKDGDNLLNIIDKKIKDLQFDTDYSKRLTEHPAANKLIVD